MTQTHQPREDLNLVPVFAALLREGSTVRAGERLGMTQSAVSRALARLRLWAKDDLFVRSPNGMKPTPRALELAGPLGEALLNVNRAFSPKQAGVAPSTRFHVALTDYAAFLLWPELVSEMLKIEPTVSFRARPNQLSQSFDLLDKGEIDLAIGPYRSHPTRFSSILVSEDTHVCVLRRNHPLSRGKMTLDRFLDMQHVLVTLGEEERGVVDRALAQIGAKRTVYTTVNQFSAALNIMMRTDLVLTVPEHLGRFYRKEFGTVVRRLPFATDSTPMRVLWHSRLGDSPGIRQLVGIFQKIGARLTAE
jgi:DNA-binding transcriptional LysR family regulator